MSILQARFHGREPPPRAAVQPPTIGDDDTDLPALGDDDAAVDAAQQSEAALAAPKKPPRKPVYEDLRGAMDKIFVARCGDLKIKNKDHGRERFRLALEHALSADRLELRASGIGATAAFALTRAIITSRQQPWYIDLGGNTIGDEGAKHFASLLRESDTLVWLALGSNGIATAGGMAIADALRTNRSLTALDLSSVSNSVLRNTLGRRTQSSSGDSAQSSAPPPGHRAPPGIGMRPGSAAIAPTAPGGHRAAPALASGRFGGVGSYDDGGEEGGDDDGGVFPSHRAAPQRPASAHPRGAARTAPPHRPVAVTRVMDRRARRGPPRPVGVDSDEWDGGAFGGNFNVPSQQPPGRSRPAGMELPHAEALVELAAALTESPTLAILRLGGNSIGADGAGVLAHPIGFDGSPLVEFSIPQNGIGADGAEALAPALAHSARLRVVDLSLNHLCDRGAAAIFLAMADAQPPRKRAPKSMPPDDISASVCGIVDLNLSSNSLHAECAPHMARGLLNRPDLTTLRLSKNHLGDGGAEALGRALREGCGLTDVNLSENHIADEGAIALGEAISYGCRLQKLDLAHNAIANRGGVALAAGVASNRAASLHTLRLVHNKLGEAAGVAMGQAAGRSTSLHSLTLQHNAFAGRAAEALVAGAELNSELILCSTDGNAVPYQQLLKLEEHLERNRRRARGAAPSKAAERLRELRDTSRTLEQAKEEYARTSKSRINGERRHRVLLVELEDARQKHQTTRIEVGQEKAADKERVGAAKRAYSLKKADLDSKRLQWHASLESLNTRKANEESKVRQLSEQCARELRELREAEAHTRESLSGLDARIDAARLRACEKETLAESLLAELSREKEKIDNRPQLRKQLPPEPAKMSEADIFSLPLPDGNAADDQMMIAARAHAS